MITALFTVAVIVQCIFTLYFFLRFFSSPASPPTKANSKGISVIICAKNEAENLAQNLPFVVTQLYNGPFEVIVVNDASTDYTASEAAAAGARVIDIQESDTRVLKGKKHALGVGVVAARYDLLLFTDADCKPASDQWLQLMTAPLTEGKQISVGYGAYAETTGLLNSFIRWETLHTFIQYSTYTKAGLPYMAVGRNLACTKAIFESARENENWNLLPSGDDDMLIRIAANAQNTAVVGDKSAFTYSAAKSTWKEWVVQKQRHLSTGKYYKQHIQMLLGMYSATHALSWICFVVLLFFSWKLALALMAFRCLLFWTTFAAAAQSTNEKGMFYFIPLFDFGWMLYNFAFAPYIFWKNKQHWK